MNAVKNNELEKLFEKKMRKKKLFYHISLLTMWHISPQRPADSAIGCATWHSKVPVFLKKASINQDGWSISPWQRASLLNNCLSSRHNVHRCRSPNQTLSLSFQLLWETVYHSKSFIIFVETKSTCSFTTVLFVHVQGPVLQRRIALLFTCSLFCLC